MRSVLTQISRQIGQLLLNRAGNIMPIAAIALIALAGMIGGGVDASRGYMIKNRLQAACDAGVLAGRRAVTTNGFDTSAQTRAQTYFKTNFDQTTESTRDTKFTPTSSDSGNQIDGTASTTMDTTVMALFGYKTVPLAVKCSASMSVGNSDVIMVLDTTGSMSCTSAMSDSQCSSYIGSYGYSETAHGKNSRLQDLRNAMNNFYQTVSTATAGSNARVRYGFVPYSSSINVGYLLKPEYLAKQVSIQSRQTKYKYTTHNVMDGYEDPTYSNGTPDYSSTTNGSWSVHSGPYSKKNDCTSQEPSTTAWSNNGSPTTSEQTTYSNNTKNVTTTTFQPQTRTDYLCSKENDNKWYVLKRTDTRYYRTYSTASYAPHYTTVTTKTPDGFDYFRRDFDASTYITGNVATTTETGNNGASENWTWEGCIEERETVSEASFSYSSMFGLTPSGATDLDIDTPPGSDNATKWKPLWDGLGYYRSSGGPTSTSTSGSSASAYCPRKAQLLKTMTKSNFSAYATSLIPTGSTYHDIGMIWGARLSSPTGIFSSTVTEPPANGGSVARHIIFMTDGYMSPSSTVHGTYGIERHDRRVTEDGSSSITSRHNSRFLAACAIAKAKGIRVWVIAFSSGLSSQMASCASPDSSFTAANADQLNDAFQEIAKNVGELRVVQ